MGAAAFTLGAAVGGAAPAGRGQPARPRSHARLGPAMGRPLHMAAAGPEWGMGVDHGVTAADVPVISRFQVEPLLKARTKGKESSNIDLSLGFAKKDGKAAAGISKEGALLDLPEGEVLVPWKALEKVAKSKGGVFAVDGETGEVDVIKAFSEDTQRGYSLMATGPASPPTMLVAGFGMHRIKDVDPKEDTRLKMKPLMPGCRCLDTCTGLAYTSIFAAVNGAAAVTTVEVDLPALEMCAANPWSRRLFGAPGAGAGAGEAGVEGGGGEKAGCSITSIHGDSVEVVASFPDRSFDRILHDPPAEMLDTFGLYSDAYYRELRRVLANKGRLFHYIGDLSSKAGKASANSAARRMEDAGFSCKKVPGAFGILAFPK